MNVIEAATISCSECSYIYTTQLQSCNHNKVYFNLDLYFLSDFPKSCSVTSVRNVGDTSFANIFFCCAITFWTFRQAICKKPIVAQTRSHFRELKFGQTDRKHIIWLFRGNGMASTFNSKVEETLHFFIIPN